MKSKILNKEFGMLTYGITPPKSSNSDDKIRTIAAKQVERIKGLDIDALIIYDVQDESDRTENERPFEFESFLDPSVYANEYLKDIKVPKIVYRCVGNYDKTEFVDWLNSGADDYSVFVGTAARDQRVKISLNEAYEERKESDHKPLLGGVTIPERNLVLRDEPQRLEAKVLSGCDYFVSQCVYDVAISKAFLREYKAYFDEKGLDIKPIIFTLTPCGSEKTLKFIKWLGIRVPKWVEEDLLQADDMLAHSLNLISAFFVELTSYAKKLDIPIGCNIESVSIRKTEIEASINLTKEIKAYIDRQI
jgi:hypothetical protein